MTSTPKQPKQRTKRTGGAASPRRVTSVRVFGAATSRNGPATHRQAARPRRNRSRREIERMIADGRIGLNGEKLTTPATLLDRPERSDGRRKAGPTGRRDPPIPLLQTGEIDHGCPRPQGPRDDLRPLAAGLAARNASRPPRLHDRGSPAAHQRWRVEASVGAAANRRRPHLPRPGVRPGHSGAARRLLPMASPSTGSATAQSTLISSGEPAAIAGWR